MRYSQAVHCDTGLTHYCSAHRFSNATYEKKVKQDTDLYASMGNIHIAFKSKPENQRSLFFFFGLSVYKLSAVIALLEGTLVPRESRQKKWG